MTKSNKSIQSFLGRFRSGGPILIPYDINEENIAEFVAKFTLDDQVDLYCVTEYVILQRAKQTYENLDLFPISLAFWFLRTLANSPPLSKHLETMKLKTSVDRIRLGKLLAL